jgi:hypothetical protein
MFNKTILQLFPALLSVCCVLLEHAQVHQKLAITLAQCIKVDQLLAQKQFQKLSENEKKIIFGF